MPLSSLGLNIPRPLRLFKLTQQAHGMTSQKIVDMGTFRWAFLSGSICPQCIIKLSALVSSVTVHKFFYNTSNFQFYTSTWLLVWGWYGVATLSLTPHFLYALENHLLQKCDPLSIIIDLGAPNHANIDHFKNWTRLLPSLFRSAIVSPIWRHNL